MCVVHHIGRIFYVRGFECNLHVINKICIINCDFVFCCRIMEKKMRILSEHLDWNRSFFLVLVVSRTLGKLNYRLALQYHNFNILMGN